MDIIEHKVGEIGEWLGAGTINFFGRQFAGKDSQAKKLGTRLGVRVISGGDIMRGADIPEDVKEKIKAGHLSPSEEYKATVLPYLKQPQLAGKPLLLSAVGRKKGEELDVLAVTEEAGHPIKAVPLLWISEGEAMRRLKDSPDRGRDDDTPEGLRQRLDEYMQSTTAVIGTYESMGLLVRVDAMQPKEIVFNTLVHALHDRATKVG